MAHLRLVLGGGGRGPRALGLAAACAAVLAASAAAAVTVSIDAAAANHPINPDIYGVAFASKADLAALNAPLNRSGGNAMSTYNWRVNAENRAADWYFESYPQPSDQKGEEIDSFVAHNQLEGAESMITVPLIGWVAKLGPDRAVLPSFSITKYGAQCNHDPWDADAGNGQHTDCSTPITGNDPHDAYIADTPTQEQGWFRHLVRRWGPWSGGGVGYYLMDNEASIWFSTHRDVQPIGPHADEYRDKVIAMSAAIKAVDPSARVVAPEEWGWSGFLYSGYDQQYAPQHGWTFPDHDGLQKGLDYIPWLLKQWKKAGRPVDVVSVHFYPQGGEFSDDVSTNMQLLRNRSTRQLWDPHYVSESWIGAKVGLIPRLKSWVAHDYYPGAPVAITEYNWGAEGSINGATAQADILGIFGREGLDMAARWTTPGSATPTFKAIQMYRNYDGHGSTFGDVSVSAVVPNPDDLSAFAATRTADGALTVMVINKALSGDAAVTLDLANFTAAGSARAYRLTSSNAIARLPDRAWSGGVLNDVEPAQSITLYVLPK